MPSLNRGFSAPIKLVANLSADDLRFLAAHDTDPFNRWQALQTLATRLLVDNVAALRAGEARRDRIDGLLDALGRDPRRRHARARLRRAGADAAERGRHRPRDRPRRRSRRDLRARAALARGDRASISARPLMRHYRRLADQRPLSARRRQRRPARAAQRLPRSAGGDRRGRTRSRWRPTQYQAADNMTDRMAALVDAVAARRAGARGRARRFLRALSRRSADHRQVVRAAGHDPGAGNARPRARR